MPAYRVVFVNGEKRTVVIQADKINTEGDCTSSNQSGPLRLRRKRDFLPLCRVVRRPLILSPSCS